MFNQTKRFITAAAKKKHTLLVSGIVLVVAAAGVGLLIAHLHEKAPGVYLTGPRTNIKLNTPYTYTVDILEDQTYHNVHFSFEVVPSLHTIYVNIPTLTAHQQWTKTFTVEFNTPYDLSRGLVLQGGYLRPGIGYHALFDNNYPITLAPGANKAPQQNSKSSTLPPNLPL